MVLWIDNNDGQGPVDYTAAVRRDAPLTIWRDRGAWTRCSAGLDLVGSARAVPVALAHVNVTDAAGRSLFQGLVETAVRAERALAGTPEALESLQFRAVDAGWLTEASAPDVLQPATAAQHAMELADVTLHVDSTDKAAELARDVTLSGGKEATQYVTELFRGDGATETFTLQHAPFRESGSGALLDDAFDGASLSTAVWTRVDPGGYLSLGAGGLRMTGGTGADGATLLQFNPPVEMGGSLVAEATNVQLTEGSDGLLLGFYGGAVSEATCVAGVRVRGTGGAHVLVAVVNGVEQAATFAFADGHSYALRVRVFCAEMQRVRGNYAALVDGTLQSFGGGTVSAPVRIVTEVVDLGLASNTLPTVLYDGALAVSPATCVFVAVNSTQLSGSVGRVSLTETGSCLVTTTAADGTIRTRREGKSGTGADFSLSSATLTFAAGLLPQAGDLVMVRYRSGGRAAARRVDANAAYASTSAGLAGVPLWQGHVTSPVARSSADCDAAVKAMLALAAGAATGSAGSVSWTAPVEGVADVLPGDAVVLSSAEGTQVLPVQSVVMTATGCDPEQWTYRVDYGQSRQKSLDFSVGVGVAKDLPGAVAQTTDTVLPVNLAAMQVTSATGTALQVDAGVDAPEGWGFEVRRSDAAFGTDDATDLVLRSAVRSFSIPRLAVVERFFVRMYDNSAERQYSALSAVLMTTLPLG